MAPGALARLLLRRAPTPRLAHPFAAKARASRRLQEPELPSEEENNFAGGEVAAPTEGISKPLAEILKELGKRVPDSLVKTRIEDNGFAIKYIPWVPPRGTRPAVKRARPACAAIEVPPLVPKKPPSTAGRARRHVRPRYGPRALPLLVAVAELELGGVGPPSLKVSVYRPTGARGNLPAHPARCGRGLLW
ncbi:uncharacterized protein C2845_PM13G14990 [Panicum miliaceum]|uniref:Uncharacterized protein n=1 Tax=Panicum miliaceum TaxID=4540 RepID=A0A3L6RHN7_PANMI|nr:uncharacterized protein C2845_PM13G14990 [Panicum miliaceum]